MATTKRTTTTKKATTSARTTTVASKGNGARKSVSSEQRLKMIEMAAYFAAEKNGFKGNSAEYWTRAEAEVDAQLTGKR